MKRLILIGNGFDLAHGMRTGYNDFIKAYVTSCLKSS
ncbi:AbiH family protein [Mucilaginibacter sp. SG564]